MPLKHQFVCPLPNGIHARPASSLEEVARDFVSEIILVNGRTGCAANSKSVLSIVGADIRHNDTCEIRISGPDERNALALLANFVDTHLPHCDDALPSMPATNGKALLPAVLHDSNINVYHGNLAVQGIACGRILQINRFQIPATMPVNGVADVKTEHQSLEEGLLKLIHSYDRQVAAAKSRIEAEMLKAHRSIARDLEFKQKLFDAVSERQCTAAGAIAETEKYFTKILADSGSALLRERVLDVQDVCQELLLQIYGITAALKEIKLDSDTILVAESLTPSQFLALDRNYLKGLVLAHAGPTSHTVILSRSFGIPTLLGVQNLAGANIDGKEALIDADAGVLLTNLTEPARRYYAMEQKRLQERQSRIRQFALYPARTLDGHHFAINANIASADEAEVVFAAGAEGIGLFRTEMLFFDRQTPPSEDEQFEAYKRVLEVAGNRNVKIRTLDVGGDKPLEYLSLPQEENPFLGFRAVRLYPAFEGLFRTQIRALVRASAHGCLKVMIPMVATVGEVRWVKKIISEEQAICAAEKIPFSRSMQIGAMIEVPAAAFTMDALCRELDFFSIGSNDLLQYFMAVDRANTQIAGIYTPLQPAFLRLLKQITDGARSMGKRICLCGEMGGQPRFLQLLVGLGLDEISTAATSITRLKAELSQLMTAECHKLFAEAIECATVEEVAMLLNKFVSLPGGPLIDPELIILDSEADTKDEAIKQAADRLFVLGRTEDSRTVEEAIWHREKTYSTGFGHGFAIPHCKSNAVKTNSLVLLKLRKPVAWNSIDGLPVRTVILLAVCESDSATGHMKVLAKLARQIMDEKFRAQLDCNANAIEICSFLQKSLHVESAHSQAKQSKKLTQIA